MRVLDEVMIIVLEVVGLVLFAAGLGAAAGWLLGWAALSVTGAVLVAGAAWAQYQRDTVVEQPRQPQERSGVRQ